MKSSHTKPKTTKPARIPDKIYRPIWKKGSFERKRYRRVLHDSFLSLACRKTNVLAHFSIECRKSKTKAITLSNYNRRKQSNEPIRIWSNYMWPPQSAGKFSLVEKVARALLAYHRTKQCEAKANAITIRQSNENRSICSRFLLMLCVDLDFVKHDSRPVHVLLVKLVGLSVVPLLLMSSIKCL